MRVLITANSAESMVWFRLPLLRALRALGHETWVMAPEGWGIDQIHDTGAHFLPLHQTQGYSGSRGERSGSYVNAFVDAQTARDIRRACRVVRPELALHYTHKMTLLGVPACRAAGVPKVHGMITGLGFANLRGGRRQNAMRAAYRGSIAVAGRLADSLILLNGDNLADLRDGGVVPDNKLFHLDGEGVDVARYAADPLPMEPGRPVFLMVGRLVRHKGPVEFVAAARIVRKTVPGARFVIAGGHDPQHPSAVPSQQIAKWRTDGVVEVLGHVDDVRPLLEACHVFVLPSYATEGLPMSIMEAMCASRAIVSTEAPGNNEAVQEGHNGFLVPQKDPDALAAAMLKLATDPALALSMGQRSRALAERRFDQEVVNAALLNHLGLHKVAS